MIGQEHYYAAMDAEKRQDRRKNNAGNCATQRATAPRWQETATVAKLIKISIPASQAEAPRARFPLLPVIGITLFSRY
jgi:hypothetical protein